MVEIYRKKCNKALKNNVFHKIMSESLGSKPPSKLGKFSMIVNNVRVWGNLYEYADFRGVALGYKIVNQQMRYVKCYYTQSGR